MMVSMEEIKWAAKVMREMHHQKCLEDAQAVLREREERYARTSLNSPRVKATVLNALLLRDGCSCQICGEDFDLDIWTADEVADPTPFEQAGLGEEVHIDHIVPVSKGGAPWDVANIQLAHPACNIRKGNRHEH